jgi:hypothetical protein
MRITINSQDFDVHFDLSDITLGKYVDWYEKHGRDLDKNLKEIRERDYKKVLAEKGFTDIDADDIEIHREIDLDNHLDNEALAWFSFWTGFDFSEAKALPEISLLLYQYRIFRYIMEDSMNKSYLFPQDIEWNNETWKVQDFQLNPQSNMSFNEIITSKEVMRQVYALGKGKWDAMPYLCCVFFRKKDEPFSDELIAEGSERMKLLMDLPMTHVMQVAFFLTVCVSIWRSTSVYSESQEVETASLSL